MKLRTRAPGKVNLCLFMGPRRDDGRHTLLTLYQSLSLADTLTLTTGGTRDDVICEGVDADNLAGTALTLLREEGWEGPPVTIQIDKCIPIAAGMAGGSADAAAALRLAAAAGPIAPDVIERVARALGSDVPSQLVSGVALGTGAGDLVERREQLPEHAYLVIPSTEALSTADVYREADRLGLGRSGTGLDRLAVRLRAACADTGVEPLPRELMVNDLQPAAISLCPSIVPVLDAVRAAGADHAMVSGSGPTVVGIWWGKDAATRAASAEKMLAGAVTALPVGPDFAAVETYI